MGFARSSSKHGAVHLDPVTLALSLGDRAARSRDGDLRLGLHRRPGERPAVLLPRAPAVADPDRRRLCGAGVLDSHRAARARLAAAARHRDRAPAHRAGAGARPLGQRQPPLAAPRGRELPGLGACARAGAHLHRQLRGAPRSGAARVLRRSRQAAGCCCSACARSCCWSRTSAPPPCCSPPASACCSSPAHGCAT